MKKLMFAAVAAAMIGGVEAAGYVDCFGVYDFNASLKTTKPVKATLKAKSNACLAEGTYFVRKQATVAIQGVIWGCDCASIATPAEFTGFRYNGEGPYDGSAFWNKTDKKGYDVFGDSSVNTLSWTILNRIDTTAKKVEGLWDLELAYVDEDGSPVTSFTLRGAGFGTADGELEGECGNSHVYIKSISGYAVGIRQYTCDEDGSSSFGPCEDPTVGPTIELIWWELCDCTDDTGLAETVAYGSWSIKFNQSAAKKGAKYAGMNENVYKFPAYILPQLQAYDPDPDPTECDVLAAAVTAAEKRVEAVQYTSLKAAEVAANKAVIEARAAYTEAYDACTATNELYEIADAAYEKALYQQTNVNAKIIWVNASHDEVTNDVVGCAAITACIADKTTYTFVKMETTIPGLYGTRTCFTWAECTALVKEFTDATEAAAKTLATTKADKIQAEKDVVTTNAALEVAQDALTSAQTDLANITTLQYEAEKALEKAEAAYTAAGCED